jgi:hypothetical protein
MDTHSWLGFSSFRSFRHHVNSYMCVSVLVFFISFHLVYQMQVIYIYIYIFWKREVGI